MDRLSQLRVEAGGSGDSTLDTTSPPSEAFMSANENSSKYFSINDSTFDITSIKDESLASTSADADRSIADSDELISNLSPIAKKELDSYKIGKQIEAAKILSGGVDIFDGDDNSFDGDELVIDDNIEAEDKGNNQAEVVPVENKIEPEPVLVEPEANVASREMEVVLQIDGNNVNAIDIGNGLYLYRKDGQDELAAIQIIDDKPQHSFKFLKVRDNAEGNLEVYEEIEIEVPKEVPTKEGKILDKNAPHVPTVDINKSICDPLSAISKVQGKNILPQKEPIASTSTSLKNTDVKETLPESKTEVNLNGKMMKFSESRKSPVVGSFTPMTFHSTPNKEGKPLTKTMVDLQLDPNRHSDNVKKTIEVHTENIKQKPNQPEIPAKEKNTSENIKSVDTPVEIGISIEQKNKVTTTPNKQEVERDSPKKNNEQNQTEAAKPSENIGEIRKLEKNTDNTIARKLFIENQEDDSKISNKELNKEEIELVKANATISEKEAVLTKDSNPVPSKPDEPVEPTQSIPNKEDKAEMLPVVNQKLVTPLAPIVEKPKPVVMNKSILNTNEAVKEHFDNKSDSDGSAVKASIPTLVGKVQNITYEKKEVEKDKPSKIKILENITLSFPTPTDSIKNSSTTKPENSVKSDDNNIKFPLESFSEVSSTCANIGNEESKEESITLYSIDTDESVSLITPSSTTKISDDKVVLSDNISEVLTTINNLNNIQSENTSFKNEKPLAPFPLIKESTVLTEAKNEADSTCKITGQINCPNIKKTNSAETSNINKNIKEHTSVLKTTLPEKATSSISIPKAKDSEKSNPCLLVSKEKPIRGISSTIEIKPRLTEIQPSVTTEIKSTGKVALSKINPLCKPPQIISATRASLVEKASNSAVQQDVKTVQAISKPSSKPQETSSMPSIPRSNLTEKKYSVSQTKLTAKDINTTPIPVDVKEISSTTSNKIIKSDSHIPVVSIANKPSLKHISLTASKVEEIVKPIGPGSATSKKEIAKNNTLDKKSTASKTETHEIKKPNVESRPVNNNHTPAVPFGKWTDAHRQEFVNKFKEVKAPPNANSKQIKNSNDLNRRDVLQKIDSQRAQTISNATAKNQEKLNMKPEAVFTNKVLSPTVELKTMPCSELIDDKLKQASNKVITLQEHPVKTTVASTLPKSYVTDVKATTVGKMKLGLIVQNVAGKVEPTLKEQITVGKTEYSAKDETSDKKTQLVPKEQVVIDKTEPIAKDQIISIKTELTSKEQSAVSKNDSVLKGQTLDDKTKCTSVDQNIADKTELVPIDPTIVCKMEPAVRDQALVSKTDPIPRDHTTAGKTETVPRDQNTASCYMASLIDRTIEDMINRVTPGKNPDESKQATLVNSSEPNSDTQKLISKQDIPKPPVGDPVSLDDIEMKMNELHGIPFVERPPHELPKILKSEIKTYSKTDKKKPLSTHSKILNTNYTASQPKLVKDLDSDEEIIEHEPVTGDLDLRKKNISLKITSEEKKSISDKNKNTVPDKPASNKDTEIITETDFDRFARRNSITYENCLTVNFDHKEPQNVIQTIKEKNVALKVTSKPESVHIEMKPKLPISQDTKLSNVAGDTSNKKYQSKIHSAYQSLTAKHQVSRPSSIIEDKPVKVVFLESNIGFVPSQLNVQGKELSPAKKPLTETDNFKMAKSDPVDSNFAEITDENKQMDKTKTKHQRKQVLTPVEEPDLELIQPSDIGIETTSKKKRKVEDIKATNLVPKKSYLLGRDSTGEDKITSTQVVKDSAKIIINREDVPEHKNTASAIDNLVKAAELLDNQAETENKIISSNPASQTSTPIKRGRGRPRKYPLPDGVIDDKSSSPQKKPRLIDAKLIKQDSISDEDDDSSEEGIIRENWTMGKINENIVCPICNKLFRSENVVFKHVKHCTGVSPSRSESDKKSPRRSRLSQESEDIEIDYDMSSSETKKYTPKKRKSKEPSKSEGKLIQTKSDVDKEDVIVIEDTPIKDKSDKAIIIDDTPVKENSEKVGKEMEERSKKESKPVVSHRNKSLVCEFCGKTFRQQSYLTSHKLQHKKDLAKKKEKDTQDFNKLQVFSCEVCKKEFRKLHHLVQHRINHNPDSVPKRALRKSLSEQNDTKTLKDVAVKQIEDASAGFRCEPCDKSFRKLHHLVEHRGTHDGINRHKPSAPVLPVVEKPPLPPQCEICKKTFRKLHHLIEHKEQHADASSDKSDDKSIKSALSTKDIIHECSLCYMVFPNEHSLNKHSAICSKKKRQSKQVKDTSENDSGKDDENSSSEKKNDETEITIVPKIVATEIIDDVDKAQDKGDFKKTPVLENIVNVENPVVTEISQVENEKVTQVDNEIIDKPLPKEEVKSLELLSPSTKQDLPKPDTNNDKEKPSVPEKINKTDLKTVKTQDIQKKKTTPKNKETLHVTKRQKSIDTPLSSAEAIKSFVESSDDDEIRYMLNPNFKTDKISEGKTFMKVRATKRNSLQIERPNSNDHAKRRTSLQLPPKISRLKLKNTETKSTESTPKLFESNSQIVQTKPKMSENKNSLKLKHIPKSSEAEAVFSTDSDDSDVKYSFPKTVLETSRPPTERTAKNTEKTVPRKSLAEKRKSLGGIAKRKSSGKAITVKHKFNPPPIKQIKKRSLGVEHRCDCGELFSSAALLARHTTLAHTPPRIRRRRDPPAPSIPSPPPAQDKHKPTRKSSAKSDPPPAATKQSPKRKSSVNKTDQAPLAESRKSLKPAQSEMRTAPKTRRSAAHSGVPVPEKMRKMMQKNIK